MKKLIVILCCLPILTFAQNPFYDAIELRKLNPQTHGNKLFFPISNGNNIMAAEILQKYTGGTDYPQIQSSLTSNAFIGLPPDNSVSSSVNNFPNSKTISPSSVGGINVTSIADGLAKFLVKRTKQELSITFFQNFKEVLDDPKYADFKALFPKTYYTLEVIDDNVYQFSHYINTLRETFEKDLQDLLIVLEPFLATKKAKYLSDGDATNDQIGYSIEYFESALLIVNSIRQGIHPAEAISNLEFQNYHANNTLLLEIQEGVKVFSIFSNSLRSIENNRFWIEPNDLKELLDTTTFKIYLGLLYQQHGSITIKGQTFSSYLDQVANAVISIDSYKDYIKELIGNAENIVVAIENIKQKKNSGEAVNSYKELFQTTLNFLQSFKSIDNLNLGLRIAGSDKVWDVLALSNAIYLDINEHKYNALILDLSALLMELLPPDKFTWKNELVKYGTFIANVAQAENSDDVNSAIEAVALPVGSSSIKKRSEFNVSLNAYVGISPGLEYNGDTQDTKFSLSVHAPIGVASSWGLNGNGSFSIFVPLIDVGAVTSFRFADEKTEELPEIKLQNIFAPGIYVVHGWKNLPISWGIGGQLGPQLREVTTTDIVANPNPTYSFKAFIAVDIPLLNFYTKSR